MMADISLKVVLCTALYACLAAYTEGADPAPPGVKVYAMTFMDLDRNQIASSNILVDSPDSGAVRINIPSQSYTQYNLLRSDNDFHASYETRTVDFRSDLAGGVTNRGITVITEGNVNVIGNSDIIASSESYKALPLTGNGREFFIVSYPTMNTGGGFYAIAAATSGCVEVGRIVNGQYVLVESLSLAAGEVYQKYSSTIGEDFTGLKVTSSSPVAVFAGHECAQIRVGTQFCDHLVEQLPAVAFWGTETVVPPIGGRNAAAGYQLRIIVSTEDTQIDFPYNADKVTFTAANGCQCASLTAASCANTCRISQSQFVEVDVGDSSIPVTVRCVGGPCLVTQYSRSYETVGQTGEQFLPDPSMLVVTPINRYENPVSYTTPKHIDDGGEIFVQYRNFLSIVVLTADRSGILLNDQPVSETGIVQGSYTILTLNVADGKHVIRHSDATKVFGALAHGHTDLASTTSSYAFPLSYKIDDVTVSGPWAAEIAIPEGVVDPDVVTVPPRTCIRSAANPWQVTFTVRGADTLANVEGCNAALTPAAASSTTPLSSLVSDINDAICARTICPTAKDDSYVEAITATISEGTLQLNVLFNTNYETTVMSEVFECRLHISQYLQREDNWVAALSTADLGTCSGLISTLERIDTQWDCPAPSTFA